MSRTTVLRALELLQLELDAYLTGQTTLDDVARWLTSYDAAVAAGRDPAWEDAARRIWALLSEMENGYSDEAGVRRGVIAMSREFGEAR
jgi:hypothetical protein